MRLPVFFAFMVCAVTAAQTVGPKTTFIPFDEARPALQLMAAVLPDDLKGKSLADLQSSWNEWTRAKDARIRARLAQGDEDSLVNLMLFGTSFTDQPRLTARQIETILASSNDSSVAGAKLDAVTDARLRDFVRAAAWSGGERFEFARTVLRARGFDVSSADDWQKARTYLLRALSRVLAETGKYNELIAQAERSNVPGAAFAQRSGLYRDRGLSSDTSIAPNFAVEEGLKGMRAKGLLPAAIRQVAIIGAGLDFADKQEGYDYYPVQTLQPFAVIDSLLRLRISSLDEIRMTTLDLSPRVNNHLGAAVARLRRGEPYLLQLPIDVVEKWKQPFDDYWAKLGSEIGVADKPLPVPAGAGRAKSRAVRIRPNVGARIVPLDVNVILQRLELAPEDRFDLVVATNVFLYYSEFERALAMANLQSMIRPGGVLLSNNALVELPASRLRFVGETTVVYSERSGNGDTMVWYRWSE